MAECIVYNNVVRKRSWSKRERYGIFKLLLRKKTINSDVYCRHLNKLNTAVNEKWPELVNRECVIFHYANATPHTSLAFRQKLLRHVWKVMLHPPYSPDLTPTDSYLFPSLQNSLNGKTFNADEVVKSYLVHFFGDKEQKFYVLRYRPKLNLFFASNRKIIMSI